MQQTGRTEISDEGKKNEVILVMASPGCLEVAPRLWLRPEEHPAHMSCWREGTELDIQGGSTS